MRAKNRTVYLVVILAVLFAACGGEESEAGDVPTTVAPSSDTPTTVDPQDMADEMAEDLEDTQDAVGGGSATLTVGDQTWNFGSVLCAFGEDEIGQEGAEFVLSAIQDGLQLYVSIDSFGHLVTLDDISDFENPSVDLEAGGPVAALAGGEEEFIVLDGKNVSASAPFVDGLSDSFDGVDGTLEATCP